MERTTTPSLSTLRGASLKKQKVCIVYALPLQAISTFESVLVVYWGIEPLSQGHFGWLLSHL